MAPAVPVVTPVVAPESTPTATPGAVSAAAVTRSGIVLLLPLKAPAFLRAAEVTRAGFMAAREAGKNPVAVQVIETDGSPEHVHAAYRDAAAQALVVVGPLTRSEVGALVDALHGAALPVPTLVLNLPEPAAARSGAARGAVALPPQMRALALNIEHEATSAARAVYRPDAVQAVVVTTGSVLQKRAAAAFTDAWLHLGGQIGDPIEFGGSLAQVRQGVERARANVVFLAADADRARLLRPYLGRNTTVIATSQVYAGPVKNDTKKQHDMNGIRFIDMPWLHQADRAALGFALSGTPLSPDLERLYALGIDAYRVASELARGQSVFELEGVTGKLRVQADTIEREPIQAEYRDGEVTQVR